MTRGRPGGRPTRGAWGARPPPHDRFFFIGAHSARVGEVDAGVDEPEQQEETSDGAEDDADDSAWRGPLVQAGVGFWDELRNCLLAAYHGFDSVCRTPWM